MRTPQQWMDLTRSVVACQSQGYENGLTNQQLIDVAMSCYYEERRVGSTGAAVWHESAQVMKHKCNCVKCNPKAPKGRFAAKMW